MKGGFYGPMMIEWELDGRDLDDNQIYYYKDTNLSLNSGKDELLKFISHLSPVASGFIFLAAGACSVDPDVTDTSLSGPPNGHEYIDDPVRPTATNSAGAALSSGDLTSESVTQGGFTFTRKITYKFVYQSSSLIVGPMRTYGLASTWVLPSTVDGSSGILLNELVADDDFNKSSQNILNVYVTLHF